MGLIDSISDNQIVARGAIDTLLSELLENLPALELLDVCCNYLLILELLKAQLKFIFFYDLRCLVKFKLE